MSYVLHIVLALAALALPELGWAAGPSFAWGVPLLVLVPYLLAWGARSAALGGRFKVGAVLERLLAGSAVLLQAGAIALGWLAALERFGVPAPGPDDWPGLDLVAALAPFLVYQLAAIDARARYLVFPPDAPVRLRAFHVRMLLSAMLPFLATLVVSSAIGRSEVWRVRLEQVGLLGGLAAALMLLTSLYAMPFFLRYAWDTKPIERGWARRLLEDVASTAGFRYRELLVWRTGDQVANAAIVGFSARSRIVLFSDLLLQQLGPRELAAVFAHEMGHARRAHAAVFGAFALAFFLAANALLGVVEVESAWQAGAVLVGLFALGYFGFGYLSRRFELEADLESLRIVGESAPLVRALELVTGAHAHARSSWRHFSTRDRVAFLRAVEHDPLVGIRLKLKLSRWRALGFLLLAVAVAWKAQGLARSWSEDWVVADLRLGRFEAAAARAEEPELDPELASLARRAVHAGPRRRAPKDLASAALDSRKKGDLPAALEWLELARMRGGTGLERLIDALKAGPGAEEDTRELWQDAWKSLSQGAPAP